MHEITRTKAAGGNRLALDLGTLSKPNPTQPADSITDFWTRTIGRADQECLPDYLFAGYIAHRPVTSQRYALLLGIGCDQRSIYC